MFSPKEFAYIIIHDTPPSAITGNLPVRLHRKPIIRFDADATSTPSRQVVRAPVCIYVSMYTKRYTDEYSNADLNACNESKK